MSARPELVRSLGRWSLAALVLNGIIGSGVFVLPGPLADRLGWMSLAAWTFAAAACAAMIFCFAEVASRFSGAGGAYLFTRVAFGPFVGMQVGWLSYFVRAITAAVQANVFSAYLAGFWPWAGTRLGGIAATTLFIGLLAAANVRSVISGARVSNSFALVKVTPLIVFGILGLVWATTGKAVPSPIPSDESLSSWLAVLLLLMFAYGGFESAVIPLSEAKAPRRDAPFALLGGLALVTLLYLLAQLTVLVTLPNPDSTDRPLADSARVMLGDAGAAIVTVAALVSVYGWLASNMLTVPRLSMAMAERGDFPAFFARVHPVFRTPWVSVLFFAGISWVLANQAGLLQNLSLASVSRLIVYGLVCAALPVLRKREKDGPGKVAAPLFRAPAGNALAAIGIIVSLALATRMNLREAATLTLTVGLATLYWFMSRTRKAAGQGHGSIPLKRPTSVPIEDLTGGSPANTSGAVQFDRLEGLPEPVQRYFRHVLREGQSPIRVAHFKQSGTLRTRVQGSRWFPFDAQQVVTTSPPGFLWDARVSIAPLLHVRVRDAYLHGTGSGRVTLLSAIPIGGNSGAELNSGALHRYLAEAAWYPTALLPTSALSWTSIDRTRALATLTDAGQSVSLEFRFSEEGEITGIYSPGRWGTFEGGYRQVPWEGHFGNYEERNGILVPSRGEVGWHMEGEWRKVWEGTVLETSYEVERGHS